MHKEEQNFTITHHYDIKNKIFLTGGTGFLGAYIIKNLVQKGIPVRALRRSAKLPFFIDPEIWEKVEWIDGDVLDPVVLYEAMQGCLAVIHSAAVVSFIHSDRERMYQVNIEGTKNVVNAAIENEMKRFVHISSVAALGRSNKSEVVTEERQWQESGNHTTYAMSKHHAELEVWRGFAEGLNGVIVNPSTILGFGDWHSSSCALFKNGYKEFPWYTEGINGFVGVEDVAEATIQLMQSGITEKRFIINGDNWSFQKLFNCIAEGFEKRKPYRKATPLLGEVAWRLEKLKNIFSDGAPLLTRESARVAHSQTSFDNNSLLKALPLFSFEPLEDIIKASCKRYMNALQAGKLTL
jgi:nucleoside-diphosphate-sugar epimerase